MKTNTKKGFMVPLLFLIIIVTGVGVATFFYYKNESAYNSEKQIVKVKDNETTSSYADSTNVDKKIQSNFTPPEPKNPNECTENSQCGTGRVCYFKPGNSIGGCTTSMSTNQSNDLTESDILNATYVINANFYGHTTISQNYIFPTKTNESQYGGLSGSIYLTKYGEESRIPPKDEYITLIIQDYQYDDIEHTIAKVRVNGYFGTNSVDPHLFLLRKINGSTIVQEIPCTYKTANGYCSF